MDLTKLSDPFSADDIEWRVGQSGVKKDGEIWARVLAYVQARAIMNRLDEVCGPQNWKVSYRVIPGSQDSSPGVICELSIKVAGDWVTKEDGAEQTDIESFKGGISSALKRAGSAWGIGRYLYKLEAGYAKIVDKSTTGAEYSQLKDKTPFYWLPPSLPKWALPLGEQKPSAPQLGRLTIDQPQANDGIQKPAVVTLKKAAATKIKPKSEVKPARSREELTKILTNLYRPYLSAYPDTQFITLLNQKYGVGETRLMTVEQMEDLVEFMENAIKPKEGEFGYGDGPA